MEDNGDKEHLQVLLTRDLFLETVQYNMPARRRDDFRLTNTSQMFRFIGFILLPLKWKRASSRLSVPGHGRETSSSLCAEAAALSPGTVCAQL